MAKISLALLNIREKKPFRLMSRCTTLALAKISASNLANSQLPEARGVEGRSEEGVVRVVDDCVVVVMVVVVKLAVVGGKGSSPMLEFPSPAQGQIINLMSAKV